MVSDAPVSSNPNEPLTGPPADEPAALTGAREEDPPGGIQVNVRPKPSLA
jgi:hypothetical protein